MILISEKYFSQLGKKSPFSCHCIVKGYILETMDTFTKTTDRKHTGGFCIRT